MTVDTPSHDWKAIFDASAANPDYTAWADYGKAKGWLSTDERKDALCKLLGQEVETTQGRGKLVQVWDHRAAVSIHPKTLSFMPLDAVILP